MADATNQTPIGSSPPTGSTTGQVFAVHGPVVDVQFGRELPPLRSWLVPADKATLGKPLLAVVSYLRNRQVRTVMVGSSGRIRAGMMVVEAGADVAAPISDRNAEDAVARIVALRQTEYAIPPTPTVIETGIKAIDLLCPLVDGDVVALRATPGVGLIVLIQELLDRRATRPGSLTTIIPYSATGQTYFPGEIPYGVGSLQTIYLPVENMANPPAGIFASVDATLHLSVDLARLGLYPAIDPSGTTSRHLEAGVVGAQHVDVAARTRDLLTRFPPSAESGAASMSGDQVLLDRARRLRRFLTQPFFVAEPWIRWTAAMVPIAETVRGCQEILDGAFDHLPEDALTMANTIDDVVERSRTG